jgi:hypothetical protein
MHPLGSNLSHLTDDELHSKYADLIKRITQAYRFGPQQVIPQLQMFMQDYQLEIQSRNRKQMDDLMKKAEEKNGGKGLSGIIDIN